MVIFPLREFLKEIIRSGSVSSGAAGFGLVRYGKTPPRDFLNEIIRSGQVGYG